MSSRGAPPAPRGVEARALLGLSLLLIVPSPSALAQTRLGISLRNDFGLALSKVPQTLPENWEERFIPAGGTMRTERVDHAFFWDVGPVLELVIPVGDGSELGFPVYFTTTAWGFGERGYFTRRKTVALTGLEWWDPVSLLEVKLDGRTPAVGMSASRGPWKLQWDMQRFRLAIQEFEGVDRAGGQNFSKVSDEYTVRTGTKHRLTIGRRTEGFLWGAYCEIAGTGEHRVVLMGLSGDLPISTLSF